MFPQEYPLPPCPLPVPEAAAALYDAAETPNYGLNALRLVAEPCIDEEIRNSAVLNFINHIKAHWSPAPVSESNPIPLNPIPHEEKEIIKTLIVKTMINASPKIQSQLSEALYVIIGHHDFPKEWPNLLPEIVAHLNKLSQSNDYALINLLLASVNSLFMKFRFTIKTKDLLLDLKYCLDNFAKPLLELFKGTASLIDQVVASGEANAPILKPCIESQRLCCCIFYSLNFQELPEFFKENMREWMVEFKKYLTLTYPAFEDSGVNGHLFDDLHVAICENISLYVIKEEDLMQRYLSGFVEEVLNLLVSSSSHGNGREQLIVTAIKFLTTVCKSNHHALFSRDDVLQRICESLVIPMVMLQDEEEELFETDPVVFVKRDMEGSYIDTRRGIACELLKGIAIHYKDKVREKVSYQIDKCWKLYALVNWRYKYCAMSLAFSLATENAAGTSVSTDIVDIEHLYTRIILEELKEGDVTSFPMIKAGALKFFMLFKNQISKLHALFILPFIPRFLTSPNYVVTSYAARCIEELLLDKDDIDTSIVHSPLELGAGYTSKVICGIFPALMSDLFGALSNPEFEENQYVMKCIKRVVRVGDLAADIASLCIGSLTTILDRVCQNPQNPLFNHYLFESLTALIRRVCVLSKKRRKSPLEILLASELERKLYPSLHMILGRDIREFFPYAFQLLVELVDLKRPLLPAYYPRVFDILRLPDTWTSSANYPGKIFLQGTSRKLNLCDVQGIYNKLVSSSAAKDHGYCVLNTVIESLGFEVISPFVIRVWVSLFNRLQNKRRVESVKNIIVFMSLFLVKDGPKNLVNSVNAVKQNAFQAILEQVWIPNLKLIKDPIELKPTLVASTRLICECPDILGIRLWGKMLNRIMTLLSRREDDDEPEIAEFGEAMGDDNPIATSFARIYNNAEDPLKEIKDPRQYLVESLSNLFAASPQGNKYYHQAISESLGKANQCALLQLFNLYNVSVF